MKRETVAERESSFQQVLRDYWLKYVAGLHCTICGNCGIIDSRGVTTAAWVEVGRLNWCICPNGQTMRIKTGQAVPTEAQYKMHNRKVGGELAASYRELEKQHGR